MTNHNDIWYESGRTARYGGESDEDDRARIFGAIVRNSMKLLQLSYDHQGLYLQPAGTPSRHSNRTTWIDLDQDNWTDLVPKMHDLIQLVHFEARGIGWRGRLNTRTERHRISLTFLFSGR